MAAPAQGGGNPRFVRPVPDPERRRIYGEYQGVETVQVSVAPITEFPTSGTQIVSSVPLTNGVDLQSIQVSALVGYVTNIMSQGLNAMVHGPLSASTPAFAWALFPVVRKVSAWGPGGAPQNFLPQQMQAVQQQAREFRISGADRDLDFGKNNIIVMPFAVAVSNAPMPSLLPTALRREARYIPLLNKGNNTIHVETSFIATQSKDSLLAVVSAARATITPQSWEGDVFITFAPFVSEIALGELTTALAARYGLDTNAVGIRNAFSFSGASCGLAVAAAGFLAAPVAYTGYLASMGSDVVLSDVEGALRHVIQGANIVETVEDVAAKCTWALTHAWPIVVPLNQSWRTVDIHNAIQFAAMSMVQKKDGTRRFFADVPNAQQGNQLALRQNNMVFPVAMADYMFGMQDVTQMLTFRDVGALILTATTLADAYILGTIAYTAMVQYNWWNTSSRGAAIQERVVRVATAATTEPVKRKVAVQKAAKKTPKKIVRASGARAIKPGGKRDLKRKAAAARKASSSAYSTTTNQLIKSLLGQQFDIDALGRPRDGRRVALGMNPSQVATQPVGGSAWTPPAGNVSLPGFNDEWEDEDDEPVQAPSRPAVSVPGAALLEERNLRSKDAKKGAAAAAARSKVVGAKESVSAQSGTEKRATEARAVRRGARSAALKAARQSGATDEDDDPNAAGIYSVGADQKAEALSMLIGGPNMERVAQHRVDPISRIASKQMKRLFKAQQRGGAASPTR